MAAWSAGSLALEYRSYPQIALADELARGDDPGRAKVLEFQRTRNGSGAGTCRQDLIRAEALIGVYLAETGRPDEDPTANDALASVERSLACQPANGMTWLQLSMLYGLQTGPTEATLQALDMSYWTAPNELHVLRRRIAFVSAMYASGSAGLADKLENDIRKLVHGARTDRIASLYVRAPDVVKPIYERYFPGESEARRTRLQRDIEQANKRIGAAPNPEPPKP